MKLSVHKHTLKGTLNQVEYLVENYYRDLLPFGNFSLREFFNFVSKKVEYVPDPPGVELVMRPLITLRRMKGDCDDKTVLMLAFCFVKGYGCGYSIVSESESRPYHHIFPFICAGGNRYDIDATYPHGEIFKRKDWKKRINKLVRS